MNSQTLFFNNAQNKQYSENPLEFKLRNYNLKLYAPTIQLNSHKGELYSGRFSREGLLYATAGFDKVINIWDVFDEKCKNIFTLDGHSNAVTDLSWSYDDSIIASSSADKSIMLWDVYKTTRIKKLKEHSNVVNSVSFNRQNSEVMVSSGEDCRLIMWDLKQRKSVLNFTHNSQLTSCFVTNSNERIYFSGIDNQIHCYNTKINKIEYSLVGHSDTITGIDLNSNQNKMISNSLDGSIRVWDLTNLNEDKCEKILYGSSNNFEKNLIRCRWSKDDKYIACGSASCHVIIWKADGISDQPILALAGHKGTVNDVDFSKYGNIVASASSDFSAILGEM